MAPVNDLQLDLEGIGVFADALDRLRGQWDGSSVSLDPPVGLGGDAQLSDRLDEFTKDWAKAATSIDTFITTLSSICRDAVTKFGQTDTSLANAVPTQAGAHHRPMAE